jgi:hypothetical protein
MFLPAGIAVPFSAFFQGANPAFVAMSVWDVTGSPVLFQAPALMTELQANLFSGKFTGLNGKAYVVLMGVYTDGTFATLNSSFTPVTASVTAQYFTPPVQSVIGLVECPS